MTELQQAFLMYAAVYLIAKCGIFVCLYVALIIVEKHARERHRQLHLFLVDKRINEEIRWKYAYNQYQKKKSLRPAALTKVS